jgi:hypothetical protein
MPCWWSAKPYSNFERWILRKFNIYPNPSPTGGKKN